MITHSCNHPINNNNKCWIKCNNRFPSHHLNYNNSSHKMITIHWITMPINSNNHSQTCSHHCSNLKMAVKSMLTMCWWVAIMQVVQVQEATVVSRIVVLPRRMRKPSMYSQARLRTSLSTIGGHQWHRIRLTKRAKTTIRTIWIKRIPWI